MLTFLVLINTTYHRHHFKARERKAGTVKFFDRKKGYGFIIGDDDGKEMFVHRKALGKPGEGRSSPICTP